jgi:hypothetical protein
MMFPKNWEKFIEDYSFKDKEEVYTNGTVLVPVFRIEQMVEHYFNNAWIPVSERLPEQGQEVIIYTGNILKPTVMAYQFWNPKYDTWTHVTHWMPLPEPPQEDN